MKKRLKCVFRVSWMLFALIQMSQLFVLDEIELLQHAMFAGSFIYVCEGPFWSVLKTPFTFSKFLKLGRSHNSVPKSILIDFVAYTAYVWWFLSHFIPYAYFASKLLQNAPLVRKCLVGRIDVAERSLKRFQSVLTCLWKLQNKIWTPLCLLYVYFSTSGQMGICVNMVFLAQKQAIVSHVPPENHLCGHNTCVSLRTTFWSSFEVVETYLKNLLVWFSVILVIV